MAKAVPVSSALSAEAPGKVVVGGSYFSHAAGHQSADVKFSFLVSKPPQASFNFLCF